MNIQTLEISTKRLEEQTKFYHQVLELKIVEKNERSVSFQIGNSVLKLVYNESFTPYHYAINIPSNQEKEALSWLKERVDILQDEEHEIQDFDFWNAKAVYFYDKDNNIVEFIARRNLKNESDNLFNSGSLLNINEIGLATLNIEKDFEVLNKVSNLPIHSGSFESFCSVGDDHGLFIFINKKLKTEWFPTQDKPYSSPFRISFQEKEEVYHLEYKDEILRDVLY